MRLIDADLQYDRLADELKWLMQYGDDVYLAVAEALRKEPIAYDIDKVVKELEKLKSNLGFGGTLQTMYADNKIDKAIEIIKQGGIRKET